MKRWQLFGVGLALCGVSCAAFGDIYLTNGFKTGDVSDSGAIVWTRTCAVPEGNPVVHERKNPKHPEQCLPPLDYKQMEIADRPGNVAGKSGFVRFTLTDANGKAHVSPWLTSGEEDDFCVKYQFDGLAPRTKYTVLVEASENSDGSGVGATYDGYFTTAPSADMVVPVKGAATSCQYFWDHDDELRGFKIYDAMDKMGLDFIVQQGDYVYLDRGKNFTKSVPEAREHWHAMNTWPSLKEAYATHAAYFSKDDHDSYLDDAHPHRDSQFALPFTFQEGVKVWKEQMPIGERQYRTFRWGKDLQIWILESREHRSHGNGSKKKGKSLLGREQYKWLADTLADSDATFKVVFSPTAIVGPDYEGKKSDSHANAGWKEEGDKLRALLAEHHAFSVNGDRHWQYASVDPITGLREFSKGPASDQHTIGKVWDPEDFRPMHKFLRVKGGFATVDVRRDGAQPKISFTFYDVDGNEVHSRTYNDNYEEIEVKIVPDTDSKARGINE